MGLDDKQKPADTYVNPMNVVADDAGVDGAHGSDTHADASMMEKQFAKIGRSVTICPWIYIICSFVVSLAFALRDASRGANSIHNCRASG